MGSDFMEHMDWKGQAQRLFFEEGKSIVDIAAQLGISRKSISAHLCALPGYARERQRRKEENRKRRREYQKNWDREKRSAGRYTAVNGDTMRREHDLAAIILSKEKY